MDQKKAAIFSHRIDQFFWGWFGFAAVDMALTLVKTGSWVVLIAMVFSGMLCAHFGRKVMAVGYSFKE